MRGSKSAKWEIFSEFLIFCSLFREPLESEITAKYEKRGKCLTILHEATLNACLNKMYQELSYLLTVSGLLNII